MTQQSTHHRQPKNHRDPETDVVEHLPAANVLCPLQHDDGQLHHLSEEAVPPQLLRDTAHDQLVADGADEERDESGDRPGEAWAGGAVDVPAQEMMDGDVPFAGEFEPGKPVRAEREGADGGVSKGTKERKGRTSRRNSTSRNRSGGLRSR